MGKPIWVTRAGDLGTIQEQTFYELQMQATDPDAGSVSYKIVAGQLPPGLILSETGKIKGQAKDLYFVQGIPFEVKQDVTSTFCVRATSSSNNKITDRTFSLTVTGQDTPEIITPSKELARVLSGDYIEVQLEAVDVDKEPITWSVSSGELPPGISLDPNTGLLSGYVRPETRLVTSSFEGWSSDARWDFYPWDYSTVSVSKSYQFTVQATDGKTIDGAVYSIFVVARDSLTADLDTLDADHQLLVTADLTNKHSPVLLTKSTDLGTYTHDNYFAYQFSGIDFDNDAISYSLLVSTNVGFDNENNGFDSTLLDAGDFMLPPGLALNTETGWLCGQIPSLVAGQTDYTFAVQVYKTDYPEYKSKLTYFTMTIVNDLKYVISWSTASDLGSITAGTISEKFVSASNAIGRKLIYSVVYDDDSSSRLPQGLRLDSNGLIVGRASFEITGFDKGALTFDRDVRQLGALVNETTVDREYTFKVKASDASGELVSYRTFKLKIDIGSYQPYETLYLKAQTTIDDKQLLQQILDNSDIIPDSVLYRRSDPYFGKSKDIRMLLLSGINASSGTEYVQAMATNHYRKVLRFGDYKIARALNDDGSVAYEVVYVDIIDDLSSGSISVPPSINLNGKIKRNTHVDAVNVSMDNLLLTMDGSGDKIIYPNSLLNMRRILISKLTQAVKEPLPRWMTSKQQDGRILGWTPAAVLAYVQPGEAARVAFNLRQATDIDLKLLSYDLDRYILDNNMSRNYNTETNSYNESTQTTFDALVSPLLGPVATADFAVSVPFSSIDGLDSAYIDTVLGGLDGTIDVYDGKKIVFAIQENFPGVILENDGWVRNLNSWDDGIGWDDPVNGYDHYEIIPGYEQARDGSTINQRSAVWLITEDSTGVLRLTVDTLIDDGDAVQILYGALYGGYILQYGPIPLFFQGDTVPRYTKFEEVQRSQETTFDNQKTRFISNITVYEDPDIGDKYLAFPRNNVWV